MQDTSKADPGPIAADAQELREPSAARTARGLIKLARPKQWSKSAFVLIGPVYGLFDGKLLAGDAGRAAARGAALWPAFIAAVAFSLTSSGLYVFNDLLDVEEDRHHPRKKHRPIASGLIKPKLARVYGVSLVALGLAIAAIEPGASAFWVGVLLAAHVLNVTLYTVWLKHHVIADVISLSLGFVLRVVAGCAAAGLAPSTWLLNATLFLSMFLAFGKRLGERRSLGEAGSSAARQVQQKYSTALLRMVVVVTAVATLLTYAGFTQSKDSVYTTILWASSGFGINLLWLTILPAIYGLIRCIVLLERGRYDDPTELAVQDRAFQIAALGFGALTLAAVLIAGGGQLPASG